MKFPYHITSYPAGVAIYRKEIKIYNLLVAIFEGVATYTLAN